MLPKPDVVETYLHDVNTMEDHELEAKYYTSGIAMPRYPMPAIRYTEELIVMNDRVSFCLMYRLPNNYMRPVGDSPQYPLIF